MNQKQKHGDEPRCSR